MNPEQVCAVVVTYNRKDLLRECLLALLAQTRPVEQILVVNNLSSDGTTDMLVEEFSSATTPQISVLQLTKNLGGAGGFYLGMKAAYEQGADWLWLMDDDSIVQPTSLEELFTARERFPITSQPRLIASKVLWTDGSLHHMNQPRISAGDLETLFASAELGTVVIQTATFVSLLLNRHLIEEYGYPIADYFIWGDDTEYTARILHSELGILAPRSVVLHKTRIKHTAMNAAPERYYLHIRNSFWMMLRSNAFTGKERLRNLLTLSRFTASFLAAHGFHFASLRAVLGGIRAGLLAVPRENREFDRFAESRSLTGVSQVVDISQ